jgi:hypothetical protein
MAGSHSHVWVAAQDGHTLIRADAIVAVGRGAGQVTAQLTGVGEPEVVLVAGADDAPIPDDFHRQLVRAVAEAAHAGGARLIRAIADDGWVWTTGPV